VAVATRASIDEAFDAGRILRTHVLRPTWHFVLPVDLRWLLTATAPRIRLRDARRYAELGLDEHSLRRAREILTAALRGGHALTRAELAAELAGSGVSPEGQRLPYLLMSAELDAVICSGPRRGKQQTYMLLGERVPEARDLPRDEALGELAARFFAGHGPATVKDLAWWASLTQAEARVGIARGGDRLRREEAGGLELWSAAGSEDGTASDLGRAGSPIVHLVQGYDEYVMGHAETRWLLARPGSSWVPATPPAGRLVILLDGRVGGFWRRRLLKHRVIVEAELIDAWDAAAREALAAEAERFSAFLGLSVESVIAR
jgi:DNA glycosylase AlkZ-like